MHFVHWRNPGGGSEYPSSALAKSLEKLNQLPGAQPGFCSGEEGFEHKDLIFLPEKYLNQAAH